MGGNPESVAEFLLRTPKTRHQAIIGITLSRVDVPITNETRFEHIRRDKTHASSDLNDPIVLAQVNQAIG